MMGIWVAATQFPHEILLLDDVHQRYRRLPHSEYEVVKAHIKQLLGAQVIQ